MQLPVARTWYSVQRIDHGLRLIVEDHVDPDWRCNIWHVSGRDKDILVDSGMGVVPLKAEIALLRERPIACVATHCHYDHAGGQHEFDERLSHAAEAAIMAAPTRSATVADRFVTEDLFSAVPPQGIDVATYNIAPAPPTRTVADGDVLDLGNRTFEVLHLPGHSPGSIALWEADSGTLFSGDVIYDGELFDHLYHSDIDSYIASLERLRALPVRIVHGGHFASFGCARLHELIDFNLRRWHAR